MARKVRKIRKLFPNWPAVSSVAYWSLEGREVVRERHINLIFRSSIKSRWWWCGSTFAFTSRKSGSQIQTSLLVSWTQTSLLVSWILIKEQLRIFLLASGLDSELWAYLYILPHSQPIFILFVWFYLKSKRKALSLTIWEIKLSFLLPVTHLIRSLITL